MTSIEEGAEALEKETVEIIGETEKVREALLEAQKMLHDAEGVLKQEGEDLEKSHTMEIPEKPI